MMKERTRRLVFVLCHAGLLLCVPLFFLYRFVVDLLPKGMSGCILHDYLFLYCPLCGGTRAIEALLRFDLLAAVSHNALVVLCFALFLVVDAIAWVRFAKRRYPLIRIPTWGWIALAVSLVGFGILRNYLMIAHGIDPLGDLGALWRALEKL